MLTKWFPEMFVTIYTATSKDKRAHFAIAGCYHLAKCLLI